MAIQYYNSLFPAITPTQLPSFNYIPRSVDEITNINKYNSIKYTFYPSIANIRSQFKSVLVRVVRGDTNSNPLDSRIFPNIVQIPYKAVHNIPSSNQVGYDNSTGEYYVDIPTKYLFQYGVNCVVNTSSLLPAVADGTLGYTLSDGKCWIRKSGAWAEVSDSNFDYTKYSVQGVYYKLQIRLIPYEIRLKSGTYNQWEVYDSTSQWVLLDENWLLNNRNNISEYSSTTSIKPTFRPDFGLVGSFKSRDSSGNWQEPYYNKDDIVQGDGISDSINIINSAFFNFVGTYNNSKDIGESISKYQFKLYSYVNSTNPYEGQLIKESNIIPISDPLAPSISWKNPLEFKAKQKFWLELWIETKNGFQSRNLYILMSEFPPVTGTVGLTISGDSDYAVNIMELDGRQLFFKPANSNSSHTFIDSNLDGDTDRVQINGNYNLNRDLSLETTKGNWIGQAKISGISAEVYGNYSDPKPQAKPFLIISSNPMDVDKRFEHKYEFRAMYSEMIEPISKLSSSIYTKETNNFGQITENNYKTFIGDSFRLTNKKTWTQIDGKQYHIVRDLEPGNITIWGIHIGEGGRIFTKNVSGVGASSISDYISFYKGERKYGLGIKKGRISIFAVDEISIEQRKTYINQFELIKYTYDRSADIKKYPDKCILKQRCIGKFTNEDRTMNGWDRILEENEYYFYFGDYCGTPYLYVEQLNGDAKNKVDLFNKNIYQPIIPYGDNYVKLLETGLNGLPTNRTYSITLEEDIRLSNTISPISDGNKQYYYLKDINTEVNQIWGFGVDTFGRFIVNPIDEVPSGEIIEDHILFTDVYGAIGVAIENGRIVYNKIV